MFKGRNFKQIFPRFLFVLILPVLILWSGSFTPVWSQTPEKPGPWIAPLNNIKVSRGVLNSNGSSSSKKLLSVDSSGTYTDLYEKDDASGRQRWHFRLSPDGVSYNILVEAGTPEHRKYLSTTSDGTKVDLYGRDDGSGRQRWMIEPVLQGSSSTFSSPIYHYHIIVKSGVRDNRKYLSTNSEGTIINLNTTNDGSGRQLWQLAPPEQNRLFIQASNGITTGTSLLGWTDNQRWTALYPAVDNLGKHLWSINRMGNNEVYKISMLTRGAGLRLFLELNGALNAQRPWSDTGCGNCQSVRIEDIGSGLVRIKNPFNEKNPSYLSISPDGKNIHFTNKDDGSGRQRWKIFYPW
jgi:hypothetical protein